MWIARDKDGELFLGETLPIRRDERFQWRGNYMCLDKDTPLNKEVTFANSPRFVEIDIIGG